MNELGIQYNALQLRIDPFNDFLLAPLGYCASFTTTK